MLNKYKELLTNTVVFGLAALGSKIILFLLVPLYTNYLTTAEYGIADLVSTTSTLVIPIVTMAVQEALFRFAFDKTINTRELLRCFYFVSLISSILVILLGILFGFLKLLAGYEVEFVFLTIISIIRDAYALFVKARDKTKLFALDAFLYVLYLCIGNIFTLIIFQLGVFGYLYSIIAAKCLSLLFLMLFSGLPKIAKPWGIDKTLLNKMLSYSAPMVLNSISWWVMSYINRYIVILFLGAASMGIYAVATRIPSLISTFVGIFSQSWSITSIKEFEENKDSKIYENIFTLFNGAVLLLTGIVLLIIQPFMDIYVGEGFQEAVYSVPFLLLGALYLAYSSFFGVLFSSARKTKGLMSSSACGAIANSLLAVILVPLLGIIGASIATAVAYGVTALYRIIVSRRFLKFNIEVKSIVVSNVLLLFLAIMQTFFNKQIILIVVLFFFVFLINAKKTVTSLAVFKEKTRGGHSIK